MRSPGEGRAAFFSVPAMSGLIAGAGFMYLTAALVKIQLAGTPGHRMS